MKPFRIETDDFAPAGDVPHAVAITEGGAADPLVWPVMDQSRGEFLAGMLPKELAGLFIEAEQDAEVDTLRVALQVAVVVVGPDIDLAIGDHSVAVGLRPEWRRPEDVFTRLDVPFVRNAGRIRRVIAMGPAAEHRPISGADFAALDLVLEQRCGVFGSTGNRRNQSHAQGGDGERETHEKAPGGVSLVGDVGDRLFVATFARTWAI